MYPASFDTILLVFIYLFTAIIACMNTQTHIPQSKYGLAIF